MLTKRRNRSMSPHNTCSWCGLPGHYIRACHVKAEGRRQPDTADRRACSLLLGVAVRPGGRGKVAARLREGES